MRLYSVWDIIKAEYMPPFLAKQDATANREFQTALAKTPNPNDYELHYLATFDIETGEITDNRGHKVQISLKTETEE